MIAAAKKKVVKKAVKAAAPKKPAVVAKAAPKKKKAVPKPRGAASIKTISGELPESEMHKNAQAALAEVDPTGEVYTKHYLPLVAERNKAMISGLKFYHAVGTRMAVIREDTGVRAAKVVSELLGLNADTCRKAEMTVACYDLDYLDRLSKEGVNWSHIRVLASIPSSQQRISFEKKVINNRWDASQLQKEVAAAVGPNDVSRHGQNRSAGRPVVVPAAVDDGLHRVAEEAGKFGRLFQTILVEAGLPELEAMKDSDYSERHYRKVNIAYSELLSVQNQIGSLLPRLYAVLQRGVELLGIDKPLVESSAPVEEVVTPPTPAPETVILPSTPATAKITEIPPAAWPGAIPPPALQAATVPMPIPQPLPQPMPQPVSQLANKRR